MQLTSPVGSLRKDWREVHIYGGGLAGLFLAYFLHREGHYQITLFEKEKRVGGKIQTHVTSSGLVETAANAILSNDHVWQLIEDLRLSEKVITPADHLKRKICRIDGEAPLTFPALLRKKEWWRFFTRPFCSPPQNIVYEKMTVEDFFLPWLGSDFCREVLTPIFSGIYALPAHELHFLSLFKLEKCPRSYWQFLRQMKKNLSGKKTSVSFVGGMEDLVTALKEYLQKHIRIQLEATSAPHLISGVNHVFCTNAVDAADLLENAELDLGFVLGLGKDGQETKKGKIVQLLRQITYLPLRTSTYFFQRPLPALENSFGVLFSPRTRYRHLGILHNTGIFPQRFTLDPLKQKVWSYTFINHVRDENRDQGLDSEQDVSHDLQLLFLKDNYFAKNKIDRQTIFYQKALPRYDEKRYQTVDQLRSVVPAGLLFFGNYTQGISLRDLLTEAKKMAKKFS